MTTGTPTALQLRRLLQVADAGAAALISAKEELCALDSVAGDGDHGLAMDTAGAGIRRALAHNPPAEATDLVRMAGAEFAAVGGSMGALLSVVFDAVADRVSTRGATLGAADVVEYLVVSLTELGELGGAVPGDKTIVDAVCAAQLGAAQAAQQGADTAQTLAAAATGAREGAESTAGMVARIGRASRLGERSRGTVDAGARSFAIALSAMADAYRAEDVHAHDTDSRGEGTDT